MDSGEHKTIAVIADAATRALLDEALACLPGVKAVYFDDAAAFRAAGLDSAVVVSLGIDAPGLPAPHRHFPLPLRLGAVLDHIARAGNRSARPGAALSFGPWRLGADGSLADPARNLTVRLTEKERAILLALHDAKGGPVPRRRLLDLVWGYAGEVETHTLETHIYRLRRKIEDDPAAPRWLLTDEEGYRLFASATASARL